MADVNDNQQVTDTFWVPLCGCQEILYSFVNRLSAYWREMRGGGAIIYDYEFTQSYISS